MAEIILSTLNAKWPHAAFGLRYLQANMPAALRPRCAIVEFDISRPTQEIVQAILQHQPRIVGLGVYIWNTMQTLGVVKRIREVSPQTIVILGGPEVSYETDRQEICRLADYIITGEADLAFGEVCGQLLDGDRPLQKVIPASLPQMDRLALPYDLYTDEDLAHRVIYVEASRGCPFSCEFCLSSLDIPVRNVPLERFLAAMESLLSRGCRRFKFVDRTFNLNIGFSQAILDFFRQRYEPGLFLHFEMIPDRFPESLRESAAWFPAGALQFEVGIQTFNEEVSERISRKQDNEKLEDNLRFLGERTGVHVHADLIVGLPGEDVESFARGFDRLVALGPQEIQVGMLKRLRGTPIVRHDKEWGMMYAPEPPYEILETSVIGRAMMARMKRFAKVWDLIANSGNFGETVKMILREEAKPQAELPVQSAFARFLAFADWLFEKEGKTHGIPLLQLIARVQEYLTAERELNAAEVASALLGDYQRPGRSDRPHFLSDHLDAAKGHRTSRPTSVRTMVPARQARHLRQSSTSSETI